MARCPQMLGIQGTKTEMLEATSSVLVICIPLTRHSLAHTVFSRRPSATMGLLYNYLSELVVSKLFKMSASKVLHFKLLVWSMGQMALGNENRVWHLGREWPSLHLVSWLQRAWQSPGLQSSGGQHTDVVIRMLYHCSTSGIWWQSLRRRPMWACSPRSWQEASVRKCFLAEPCCDWKDLGYVRMHSFYEFPCISDVPWGELWSALRKLPVMLPREVHRGQQWRCPHQNASSQRVEAFDFDKPTAAGVTYK